MRLTRRQVLLRLGVYGPLLLGASYGVGIERNMPKVERISFRLPDFPGELRAVHLSDLHMHADNRLMRKSRELSDSFDPEFIFLTGDLVEDTKELPACLEWISALKHRHAVYFVPGNWEHWSKTLANNLVRDLGSIGVRTLQDSGEIIDWKGGKFFLAGIDDYYYGRPKPDLAFKQQPKGVTTILLSHSPMAIQLGRVYRCDLVLAGHTHGGQVRIPGIGAVKTPPGSGPYQAGLYTVGPTKLYVNRGIGTSTVPIRILCPPEVTHLIIREA
jgi:uncharacterized protein